MLELNKNIFGFFLCLLNAMVITKAVSATPSLAPSTLTRPLDSNTQISPTLAIILSCLVLFLMAVIFVYIRRMNASSFDEVMGFHFIRQRPVTRGLDPNIIKTFPIFIYSDVKALKIGKSILECAVCLNEFEDEETLRLIPQCCHVFHPECIDAWLAFRITCPVCRENLKTKPGDLEKLVHVESQNANSPERNDAIVDIYVNIVGAQEVVINPPTQTHGHSCSTKSTSSSYKTPKYIHLPPKSTTRRPKILNMFSRSHSTGHSLIQPDENSERFTLRLPDDARKRLVDLNNLNRSYNGPFYLERSSTKGYRFLPTPPMFTKSYQVKEEKGEKELKNLQKSASSLFRGTENDDDDTGERSFTYLRSSTSR